MSIKPTSRRLPLSGGLCLVLLSALTFAAATGCNKSEAAPARRSTAESAVVAAGPKAETENYVAEIRAGGSYKAGAEGTVEIVLTTKGVYHTNAQYPYRFKAADPAPDGVTYPKPVLQRADGSFDEKKGTFKLPFTASKPGKYTIGGTFSLSVCSEANCIMDKVPLEVSIDVK
jgi:hypothetical protein